MGMFLTTEKPTHLPERRQVQRQLDRPGWDRAEQGVAILFASTAVIALVAGISFAYGVWQLIALIGWPA